MDGAVVVHAGSFRPSGQARHVPAQIDVASSTASRDSRLVPLTVQAQAIYACRISTPAGVSSRHAGTMNSIR